MTLPSRVGRTPLGAFFRSPLGVLARDAGELAILGATDVEMVWSVEFIRYNATTDTKLATVAGTVILHDRWFWVSFHLMSGGGRGICSVNNLKTESYSAGTPEPVDGLHEDGNLTIETEVNTSVWAWGGWNEIDGDGEEKDSVIDTGSAVEFRRQIVSSARNIDDPPIALEGVYAYDPNVQEGAVHTVLGVDKWIMLYLDGMGGLSVSRPSGGDEIRVAARVLCVITV